MRRHHKARLRRRPTRRKLEPTTYQHPPPIGEYTRLTFDDNLTDDHLSWAGTTLHVTGPLAADQLHMNRQYLNAKIGPWASDRAFTLEDDRATFSGRQATIFPLVIGPEPVFSLGDAAQVQLADRPMWVSASQDAESGTITLDLDDGNSAGQTIRIAKAWLWDRGFLGLDVTHEDGTTLAVADSEDEDAYMVDVPHFSELLLDDHVVLGQLGSGPIVPHPSDDIHWDPDNLTKEVDVDDYLVSYTVYLNKTWMDTEMPEPVLDTFTWTVENVSGQPYYKVVLGASQTPATLHVESIVNDWWERLEGGGTVVALDNNTTIEIPVSVSSSFVSVNGSLAPDYSYPNETNIHTQVLRGRNATANATAVVSLAPGSVAVVVHYHGSHRLNIPAILHDYPPNGTSNLTLEPGESLRIGKYIYDEDWNAIDPTNVIFYDDGAPLADNIMVRNGWYSSYGSSKSLWFGDGLHHGGSTSYQGLEKNLAHSSGHWAGPHYARYHARMYSSGSGDTHDPGFRSYVAMPVHFESCFHTCVDPSRGQDFLFAQMALDPAIGTIWPVEATPAAGHCSSCSDWDGVVDLYQIGDPWNDPCANPTLQEETVITTKLHLTCPVDPETRKRMIIRAGLPV